MRTDFCSGCGKLVTTNHPLGLCHDCELRWQERARKEAAWNNTPKRRKLLIRTLQTLAVISGIIALECAFWILEPAIQRLTHHPLIAGSLFAAGVIAFLSWRKARNIKHGIIDAA